MKVSKIIIHIFVAFFLVLAVSCSTTVKLKARADLTSDMDLTFDIGAYFAEAIEGMASATGEGLGLSKEAVENSFSGSDFTNVQATVPNKQEVILSARLNAAKDQSVSVNGIRAQDFIKCSKNSLTFTLSPKAIQTLYSSLNEESRAYADLLMAPVFTGDRMSASEYKELLSAVYGKELADETEKARIKISLEPPKGKGISSSSADYKIRQSSSSVTFSVPALELLTLTKEMSFKIDF